MGPFHSGLLVLVVLGASCRLVAPSDVVVVVNPVPQGSRCSQDAQCESGYCVDRVCCESRCEATCYSCANPGSVGRCTPVEDNTDPDADCGAGDCFSCVQGSCRPSAPNTNPENACMAGQTCNGLGACARETGSSCTQDSDCALGVCLAQRCRTLKVDMLPVVVPFPGVNTPVIMAATRNEAGLRALAVHLRRAQFNGDDFYEAFTGGALVAAVEQEDGSWTHTVLASCVTPEDSAAIVRVGQITMVLELPSLESAGPCPGAEPATVYQLGPQGDLVAQTRLTNQHMLVGPGSGLLEYTRGKFVATLVPNTGAVFTLERQADGTWSPGPDPGIGISQGALTPFVMGGMRGMLDLSPGGEIRVTLDGDVSAVPIFSDCLSLWRLSIAPLADGARALVAYACNFNALVVDQTPPIIMFYDRSAPAGARLVDVRTLGAADIEYPAGAFPSETVNGVSAVVQGESSPMFISLTTVGDSWLVAQAAGAWRAFPVAITAQDIIGSRLRARDLITLPLVGGGTEAYWTRYYREPNPDDPIYEAILVRATITP